MLKKLKKLQLWKVVRFVRWYCHILHEAQDFLESQKENAMEHLTIEELNKRVAELERLAWSIFRALETYATFNERPPEERAEEEDQEPKAP